MDKIIEYLDIRLQQPMPGMEASKEMFPIIANGDRIKMEHDETAREGGVMILLYSLSFESKFDVPKGGIFLGIIIALLGIILYMFSKKSNGMIRVR